MQIYQLNWWPAVSNLSFFTCYLQSHKFLFNVHQPRKAQLFYLHCSYCLLLLVKSPPSKVRVKNKSNITYTHPTGVHGTQRDNVIFIVIVTCPTETRTSTAFTQYILLHQAKFSDQAPDSTSTNYAD
jgi:hypothetical protein